MAARCETIGKIILPVFRSLIAKELVSTYNLTQVQAAQRLGTTQAAITQYINSKRALKGTEQFAEVMPKLQEMARVTAKRLANREITYDEVSPDFCKLCVKFCVSAVDSSPEDYVI
jgi:predicted transcriptional regulator